MRPPTSATAQIRSIRYELPLPPSLLIRRGRSGIHGAGVYARIAIPEGHLIVEYRGERITKTESVRREAARLERIRHGREDCTYIFDLNGRHDLDGRRGGNISRFINHSCAPNCRSELNHGRIWIITTRDVAPDEEITFDYGFPFRDWAANPCRCGSGQCAGFIVAEGQRWRLRRLGHLRSPKASPHRPTKVDRVDLYAVGCDSGFCRMAERPPASVRLIRGSLAPCH